MTATTPTSSALSGCRTFSPPPPGHHSGLLTVSTFKPYGVLPCRAHQDCAAKARKVLQNALTASILRSRGVRTDAAAAAAKAAAASAAAAFIAAGGDHSALDGSSADVLRPLLGTQLVPAEQKKLLLPLLRLRQACIHPQVTPVYVEGCAHVMG